jgi:uracil-DNA glycosylase family 4
MQGFFATPLTTVSMSERSIIPKCAACKLDKGCVHAYMPVSGEGRRKILLLGEAPGKNEDLQNRQFVGKAGQELIRALAHFDIDMRKDCWLHNSLSCRPAGNAAPTEKQISYCRPLVIKAVQELKPEIIVPLGTAAISSLIGWLWKEKSGGVGRWAGWRIPHQRLNAWICPTYHPSYVMRSSEGDRPQPVVKAVFYRQLRAIFDLQGRPWTRPPIYSQRVVRLFSDDAAAAMVEEMVKSTRPLAFDFETNMLKPESDEAEIVCCSVSDGRTSVAFPWLGQAIEAVRDMLWADNPKIGGNLKFEERWCRRKLKRRVKNWQHDTVVAAHTLDNRKGVSSVKFQSFVQLGQDSYDDGVKQYLKGRGGNLKNRIKDIPLPDLLFYCGMDSLVEWHIARRQRQQMGVA